MRGVIATVAAAVDAIPWPAFVVLVVALLAVTVFAARRWSLGPAASRPDPDSEPTVDLGPPPAPVDDQAWREVLASWQLPEATDRPDGRQS